jgi:hypothetical protein
MDLTDPRIVSCQRYLSAVDEQRFLNWQSEFGKFSQRELSLEESMALLHPVHYQDRPLADQVRGSRTFGAEVIHTGQRCQSALFWGYDCMLPLDLSLVSDHSFPWSLGGPTVVENKIFLCQLHNQLKGNDVHAYPWEMGEPDWLGPTLGRIARIL